MNGGKIAIGLSRAVPVEVRDRSMRLVARGISSEPIELPGGEYFVQATLPSDETWVELVRVEPGETTQVGFASYDSVESSAEQTLETVYRMASSLPSEFRRKAVAPWKVRFWAAEGWKLEPTEEIEVEKVETDDLGTATLTLRNPHTAVVFAAVATEGTVPVNVALPALGIRESQRCQLAITTDSTGAVARALPFDSAILDPARYLADGDLRSAAQYLGSAYAEELLQGKMMDPLAAALGGYVLLIQGELERLHDWPSNLANWFPYLADGAAIDGERLALMGDHESAFDRFLQLRERGLPIFTDGFSLALSRLRHYATRGGKRAATRETSQARELADRLDAWAIYAEHGALTLTVRVSDLADPAGDEARVPPDLGDPHWHGL